MPAPPVGRPSAWRRHVAAHLAPSSFVRQVGETYATQIVIIALGFINSILVTRLLGPEGRGLFAAANAFAAVGVQFANLGLHSSNTYFVSRDPRALPRLLGNSLLVSLACAALALAAAGLFAVHPQAAPVGGVLLALSLAAIPIGLANLLVQNLLIGTQRIRTYNVIDLTTRGLAVFLVAATAPLGVVAPDVIFGLVLATVVIGLGWGFVSLRRTFTTPLSGSWPELRTGLGYGLRAYFGSLFSFLVLKSDVLLVKYLRGAGETGYYAIAVGLSDILMILPVVVGTVLFPRLSAAGTVPERWRFTRRILGVMVPVVPVVLIGVFVVARPLIRLAYGLAFDPSFPAVAWLLPGLGCLAVNMVLMNFFASCGQPPIAVFGPLIALVVNVGLNLVLVPRIGFVGAAISSTIAYALMLALSVAYLRFWLLSDEAS